MNLLNLPGSETMLRKVAGTHGGEYAGPCPWCGGRDRFRVWPYADRPGYWCRQCDRKGDAIQYLRDREGLSFREACERLGRPLDERPRSRPKRQPEPPPLSSPPGDAWQAKAHAFSEAAEHGLWKSVGAKALAYLRTRGLCDETIRAARLGYHPAERWESPEVWGLEASHKKIWLPPGIIFPWYLGPELWRISIRREGKDLPKEERYIVVSGGSNCIYRANSLQPARSAALVEGTLDALSLAQEAGDLIAVVATGTTWGRRERWIGRLALASVVLVAFDADEAGEQAAAWWLRALGMRAKRWRPYWDDPNAMLQAGADLRTWVREGLGTEPRWWREVARWPEERREVWAERAAIMEVDGGLLRDEAERHAFTAVKGA